MKLLNILLRDLFLFYLKWTLVIVFASFGLDKFGLVNLESDSAVLMTYMFILCFILYVNGISLYSRNFNWMKNVPVTRQKLLKASLCFSLVNASVMVATFFILLNVLFIEALYDANGVYFLVSSEFYSALTDIFTVDSSSINDYPATIVIAVLTGGGLFCISFLFFVGVKGAFTKSPRLETIRSLLRRIKPNISYENLGRAEFFVLLLSLFLVYYTYRFYSLSMLLIAFACTITPYAALVNIAHRFNLKNNYRALSLQSYGLVVLVTSGLVFGHAQNRLNHKELSAENRAYEALILGPSFYDLKDEELGEFLAQDISNETIEDLMEFAYRRDSIFGGFHNARIRDIWDFKNKRPITEFQAIINSKTKLSSLEASLGLFKVNELGFDEIKLYFEKAQALEDSPKSKEHGSTLDYHSVSKYLSWKDFSRDELAKMLSSKNSWLHRLALENIYLPDDNSKLSSDTRRKARVKSDKVKYDLTAVIIKNFDLYDSSVLSRASEVISAAQCRSISSTAVLKEAIRGQEISTNLNCSKYEEASDFAQKENYYLGGEYFWKLKHSQQN